MESAERALNVFKKKCKKGGVLCFWEKKYPFYSEFPPENTFILNGFIYALVGLYDMYNISGNELAKKLFCAGEITLNHILPLYNLKNKTIYDLRHLVYPHIPPSTNKEYYQKIHIELIKTMFQITGRTHYKKTYERWSNY